MPQIGDSRSGKQMDAPLGASADDSQAPPIPQISSLIVSGTLSNALGVVSLLTASHFHVTVADSYARANQRLVEHAPALLITELRLGEYNGLQLVFRGKERRPKMAAVVLTSMDDAVLQADAEAMGATFVLTPISVRELMAAALRTLMRGVAVPGEAGAIRPPFERRHHERRQRRIAVEKDRRHGAQRRDMATLMAWIAATT